MTLTLMHGLMEGWGLYKCTNISSVTLEHCMYVCMHTVVTLGGGYIVPC